MDLVGDAGDAGFEGELQFWPDPSLHEFLHHGAAGAPLLHQHAEEEQQHAPAMHQQQHFDYGGPAAPDGGAHHLQVRPQRGVVPGGRGLAGGLRGTAGDSK